jgi:formylglycine-generating enzyme
VPSDEPLGNPCTDDAKRLAIQAQCGEVICGEGVVNAACNACGDGKKNGTEECDGAELGVTCTSGSASCGADCKLNLSSCALAAPPSCAGQPALCGPSKDQDCGAACGPAHDQDCCDAPLVPGGNFFRSYEAKAKPGALFSSKAYPAKVTDFRLDRYEVTVGRFRRFVDAVLQGWKPPPGSGLHAHLPEGKIVNPNPEQGWNASWDSFLFPSQSEWNAWLQCGLQSPWTSAPGPRENFALPCINWYQAYAFCTWDGGFLPSQAEANYVASGGSEQRVFPWSSPPGSKLINASFLDPGCLAKCPDKSVRVPGFFSPKGDGKWGHADLSGGLIEWVLDWPTNDAAQAYILAGPCDDCALTVDSNPSVLNPKKKLRLRGDYRAPWEPYAHSSALSFEPPSLHGDNTSVRCARIPAP